MITVEYMKNPVYSREDGGTIDCLLKITSSEAELPFTASPDDIAAHGVAIYRALLAGEGGPIGPYVPPPPRQAPTPPPSPPETIPLTEPRVI